MRFFIRTFYIITERVRPKMSNLHVHDDRVGVIADNGDIIQKPTFYANGAFWNSREMKSPTRVHFGLNNRFFYVLPNGVPRITDDVMKEILLAVQEALVVAEEDDERVNRLLLKHGLIEEPQVIATGDEVIKSASDTIELPELVTGGEQEFEGQIPVKRPKISEDDGKSVKLTFLTNELFGEELDKKSADDTAQAIEESAKAIKKTRKRTKKSESSASPETLDSDKST